MARLLLGSGGIRTAERLDAWNAALDAFLGPIQRIVFLPYALADHDAYVRMLYERGVVADRQVVGLHSATNPVAAIAEAQAVFVGGGNTWRLLRDMYQLGLLEPIRQRVAQGMPFIGISAGTNVACPTMQTTNDMAIVMPPSVQALALVPFQINAHYFSGPFYLRDERGDLVPYAGETRDDRLREFHEMNDRPVLGLWEGAILRIEGDVASAGTCHVTLHGPAGARWFRRGLEPLDFHPGASNLSSWLLASSAT